MACEQLKKDGITILHTVGGDDTNTQAAELAKFLGENGYTMTVVGLPKVRRGSPSPCCRLCF